MASGPTTPESWERGLILELKLDALQSDMWRQRCGRLESGVKTYKILK
jgi:hypothetical protein